jgi:hypothetical protein
MLHPSLFGGDSSLLLLFQLMLPYLNMRGTGIGLALRCLQLCCYTTNTVDWVVQRSNHRAILSLAATGPDLPVPAPRHGSPPVVPRLVPSGTVLCTVPRPKSPVYRLRGCWPFVYVMPQDVAVYHHAGRSSLTSWGTFRSARAVPGRDILVAVILVSLARKSRELVCDVSFITDELVWAVRTATPCCHKASARWAKNVPSLYRCCHAAVRTALCVFVCTARPGRLGRPARIPGIVTYAMPYPLWSPLECCPCIQIPFLGICCITSGIHDPLCIGTLLVNLLTRRTLLGA